MMIQFSGDELSVDDGRRIVELLTDIAAKHEGVLYRLVMPRPLKEAMDADDAARAAVASLYLARSGDSGIWLSLREQPEENE